MALLNALSQVTDLTQEVVAYKVQILFFDAIKMLAVDDAETNDLNEDDAEISDWDKEQKRCTKCIHTCWSQSLYLGTPKDLT